MKEVVKKFLERHWDGVRPLLLGYSGGPDSKALLYALYETGVRALHVAHVDHGWRSESAKEAEMLQKEVEGLGYPFHITRLFSVATNREAAAREERLLFFRSLTDRFSCQALLLAHQADDLAETALKRALEGAHLSFLEGMRPVSSLRGLSIWRPFLFVKKKELLFFLSERKLEPLCDATNLDSAFLRSRMRFETLPALSAQFGKEVSENLLYLSRRSSELRDYLDRRIASIAVLRGPWGCAVQLCGLERVEARHLVQSLLGEERLSRDQLEQLLDWTETKKSNARLTKQLIADRGMAFFLTSLPPPVPEMPFIAPGVHFIGGWRIEVEEAKEPISSPHWRDVWSGRFSVLLPPGTYSLAKAAGSPFRKLWNAEKVPAFFRSALPVVWQEGAPVGEFLSGKSLRGNPPFFKMTLSF